MNSDVTNKLAGAAVALSINAVAAMVAVVLVWLSRYVERDPVSTVTFVTDSMKTGLNWGSQVMVGVPLIVGIVMLVRRQWLVGIVSILSVPFLFVAVFVLSMFFGGGNNWRFQERVQGSDGADYVLAWHSAGGVNDYNIVRDESTTPGFVSGELLAHNNRSGDGHRTGKIVRPANADTDRHLLVSDDGNWLVVTMGDNCVRIAYHVPTGRSFGAGRGSFDPNTLSPFVLLDADSQMHPGDVASLRTDDEACGYRQAKLKQIPNEVMREATEHPNGAVRELAEELVERAQGTPYSSQQHAIDEWRARAEEARRYLESQR